MFISRLQFVKRTIVIVLLNVMPGLLVSCSPYSPFFWMTANPVEVHVFVPEQFEGHILLVWQTPNGAEPQYHGDVLIYRLQSDGVLLLRSAPLHIGNWRFFYESSDGSLQVIPQSPCLSRSQEQGVIVCTGGRMVVHNTLALRPNQRFYITTLRDFHSGRWTDGEIFFQQYDNYLSSLALPDEP